METKILHGNILPKDVSQSLIASFNHGNLQVQQIGDGDQIAVQISTNEWARSGGNTALSILLQKVEDGISVQIGQQQWMGIAASIGYTALATLLNPINLLNRLDDLAQDIEYLHLKEEAWKVIDSTARSLGAGYELSERLKRLTCEFCGTANPAGEPHCIACGAPSGGSQPLTCQYCGFVITHKEKFCPNCGKPT